MEHNLFYFNMQKMGISCVIFLLAFSSSPFPPPISSFEYSSAQYILHGKMSGDQNLWFTTTELNSNMKKQH
jgi:hypothetical protein